MVNRFHSIIDEFTETAATLCRSDVANLPVFDVFEPTLIAPALKIGHNFGLHIFGEQEWLGMGGDASVGDDLLTVVYCNFKHGGLLQSSTKLAPDFYHPLILDKSVLAHRTTFTFHGQNEMWFVTRNVPPALHAEPKNLGGVSKIREIMGSEQQNMLFKLIVENTQGISIGPLEYCCNGHIVHIGSIPQLAVCKGDSTIPKYFEEAASTIS
ncbi:hypothetical protein GGX14DRAFT_577985 [Mycena pura]|uniref:Uncharacterized protein n=1 Tax=Mycena pura TaxID=153505 RepID=A0AAD6UQY3_9AGAR|nr:hypothetical protein GGX14DRAFT_577985 [Mycena pura]